MINIESKTEYSWGVKYETTVSRSEDEPESLKTRIITSITLKKDNQGNHYQGKSQIFTSDQREFLNHSYSFDNLSEEEMKKIAKEKHERDVRKIKVLYEKGEKIPQDFFRQD